MTKPHPETIRRRLERAGYSCLKDLWVPAAFAARVRQQAEMHPARLQGLERGPPPARLRPQSRPSPHEREGPSRQTELKD